MVSRIHSLGLIGLAGLAGFFCACSENGDGDAAPMGSTDGRAALLASVTDRVILPSLTALESETSALMAAVSAAAAAPSDATALATARGQFERASIALQRVELMQLGPAGARTRVSAGEDLRDEMYSWPSVSACRVDQETVKAEYGQPDFFDRKLTNVYGLDALEYLLFVEGEDNACPASQTINANGTWNILVASGNLTENRLVYAAAVASRIHADAIRLLNGWRNGFADQLKTAGSSESLFSTNQEAVNQLFAALFYFESKVKDSKLAAPLGINAACSASACPDLLESQHARLSLQWIQANVDAFQSLFLGGEGDEGFGFDDLLEAEGFEELAQTFRAELAEAVAAGQTLSPPMADQLEGVGPRAYHDAVNDVGRLLKTQLVSALALKVPNEGAADND